jgi:hypothetical protein
MALPPDHEALITKPTAIMSSIGKYGQYVLA